MKLWYKTWQWKHNSLECHQTRQASWGMIDFCVNTSFMIHRADYKRLTGIIKRPLMCQEQTTAEFLWEHGRNDKECLEQVTETAFTSAYMCESLADFNTIQNTIQYQMPRPPHDTFTSSLSLTHNPSPLMGPKGQPLIIHLGCQTMLAGCYLGWGRPIE